MRKDVKTTKVRIVNDASSKESKDALSINDCFHTGPLSSPLLHDILLRLRQQKVTLIADVETAVINIEVVPKERVEVWLSI